MMKRYEDEFIKDIIESAVLDIMEDYGNVNIKFYERGKDVCFEVLPEDGSGRVFKSTTYSGLLEMVLSHYISLVFASSPKKNKNGGVAEVEFNGRKQCSISFFPT